MTLQAICGLSENLAATARNDSGFCLHRFVQRWKKGLSGRLAKEFMSFDRTHPKQTTKRHQVWEANREGEMHLVHDEECHFPAKRRPVRPPDAIQETEDKGVGQDAEE
jgi:hypothetical protein